MRRSFAGLTALAAILLFAACEGPIGPTGAQGAKGDPGDPGATGPQGPAGQDGTNALNTCSDCHVDDTYLLSIQFQYSGSQHAAAETVGRGSSSSCGPCHAHEGFVDAVATGSSTSSAGANFQTPINCRTCHLVHNSYTSADLALRTSAAVSLRMNAETDSTFTVDIGKGNLCANCHQPRPYSFMAELFGPGPTMTVTRSIGPHHGPQSAMLTAQGGYEYAGEAYRSSSHEDAEDGCVACHMALPAYANEAGGHTWGMEYDDHGVETLHIEGCIVAGCHDDVTSSTLEDAFRADAEAERAAIWDDVDGNGLIGAIDNDPDPEVEDIIMGGPDTGLLVDLKKLLVQQVQIMTADDGSVTSDVTAWPLGTVGAMYNYNFVREDHSRGIHNFKYATDLLNTAIAAVTP